MDLKGKTSEEKKATIILLCYCQEKTIGRAIESLLNQECKYPYEILIADDGSTDQTREICENYAEKHPNLIRLMPKERNKGLIDNYFDAIECARGEYIADCAGDDEWIEPTRLQQQIESLDAHTTLAAVCCDVEMVKITPNKTERSLMRGTVFPDQDAYKSQLSKGEVVLEKSLNFSKGLPFVLSSALFRKSIVTERLQNNPDTLKCYDGGVEDVPMIAAIGAKGDVLRLPFVGYRYYIEGESISNNLSFEKEYRFHSRVARMVRRLGNHYGLSSQDQKNYFNNKFPYLAAQIRHSGNLSLYKDFRTLLREWNLPIPLRGSIHLFLFRLRNLFTASPTNLF